MSPPNRIRRVAAPVWLALPWVLALTACETPLERAYGRSQTEHVARSIENPQAGQADGVVASDGRSTDGALYKHREAERRIEEAQPRSVIQINTGN